MKKLFSLDGKIFHDCKARLIFLYSGNAWVLAVSWSFFIVILVSTDVAVVFFYSTRLLILKQWWWSWKKGNQMVGFNRLRRAAVGNVRTRPCPALILLKQENPSLFPNQLLFRLFFFVFCFFLKWDLIVLVPHRRQLHYWGCGWLVFWWHWMLLASIIAAFRPWQA